MRIRSRRSLAACAAVLTLGVSLAALPASAAPGSGSDGKSSPAADTSTAIVQLQGDPLATAANVDRSPNGRVKMNGSKTKSQRAVLVAQRNAFKSWLRKNAPKAKVTAEFDTAVSAVVVQLNGTPLAALQAYPLAISAEYETRYTPSADLPATNDPDLALIRTTAAWQQVGGAAGAGAGVKVGVLDTGIEQSHSCFDDMGDSDGPNNFTNNKVIVAKVFNRKAKGAYTPAAIQDHGTHVAGTIACDYGTAATVDGVSIPFPISGVAPAARLGNYNVFPGNVQDAGDQDLLAAMQAAYEDGMDIINMSLGGPAKGQSDSLSASINNLDKAGMVVAVAAGNSGPGWSTVESPGRAERALTAGAASVSHIVTRRIEVGGQEFYATPGEFGAVTTGPLGTLQVVYGIGPDYPDIADLSQACTAAEVTPADGANRVAVIARGTCTFTEKIHAVQTQGYTAVIVVNREEDTLAMAGDGTPLPALLVPYSAAIPLKNADGQAVSVTDPAYFAPYELSETGDMADFSSQGPTPGDLRIKPDLVAPGKNVLSSVTGNKFAFFNGTSMATPHLAGAAAVVLGKHADWAPWQVRSAITNTADLSLVNVHFAGDVEGNPMIEGAGMLDVNAALNASVFLSQPSLSFGKLMASNGTTQRTITAVGGAGATVSVAGAYGPVQFTAALNGERLVVSAIAPRGASGAPSWADIQIRRGGAVVSHFRVFALVG